jgi:hypothetical protein
MLALDSPVWSELQHAYGSASDVPALLSELSDFPDESDNQAKPWFGLWSALCHQGDVYSASFAAVPHIVAALETNPGRATMSFFLLPASIEVARHERAVPLPASLESAYLAALAKLPALAAAASRPQWAPDVCTSAVAAVAAATGNHLLAQLIIEVEGSEIPEVLEWLENR